MLESLIFRFVTLMILSLSLIKDLMNSFLTFTPCYRALVTRLLSQGYKVIICPTHLRNSMVDTLIKLDNTRKMSAICLLILSVEMIFIFMDLPMAELIKLAKMAGITHEANHA